MLALFAGIAFAMSVWGGRWWVIGETEVGPYGAKRCFEGSCIPAGLNWLGVGDRWMRIGMGAWAGGLISALMLVVLSAGLAAKRIPTLVAKTVLVSIATALITGGWFMSQFPSAEFPAAEYGRGALLFALAIAAGVAAAILVLRGKPTAT
jgi:hypothetical protein